MPASARRRRAAGEEEERVGGARLRYAHDSACSSRHLSVFIITFFSFALIHATRKTLSTVKGSMISVWTHNTTQDAGPLFASVVEAEDFLALLDFGFLFAYAFGLYVGGMLGDRYNPRVVLSIGMWLSAIVVFMFGYLTEVFHFYSTPVYFILWVSSGLFQSVGWPTEVCIVGNWFGRGSRGLVLGAWSACASAGNIIGTLISSRALLFGYQYAFALNSSLLFAFGFVVFFFLSAHPRELGLPEPSEWAADSSDVIEVVDHPRPIGFWKAWALPGVAIYSFAYACLKLVNYGFFFWLPFYLHSHFGWPESEADTLSTFYDAGGIVAAIVGGACSDRLSTRTPVVFVMLIVSSICLFVYSFAPGDFFFNATLLSIVGFFVGGPANMISSCVSADLGKARELHGSADALSTVTGIVDGTGSVGAAIGQLLIPAVQRAFGWGFVFYGFIVMVLCTAAFLLPMLWKEYKQWRAAFNGIREEGDPEAESLLAREDEE